MLTAALAVLLAAGPVTAPGQAPRDPGAQPAGSASMQIVVVIPPLDEIPMAPGAVPATGAAVASAATAPAEAAPTLAVRADARGYTAEVTGRETGPVELWDGDRLVAVVPAGKGAAAFHSNGSFGELVARRGPCWSQPVRPPHGGGSAPAGNVSLTIPPGALTLSTRGDVVTVTDTRPGNLGFHVAVTARRATTLRHLEAVQVTGNAMRARDLAIPATTVRLRAERPTTVATFPAQTSLGSVRLRYSATSTPCLTWTVL